MTDEVARSGTLRAIKHLLCAVDLSEPSAQALRFAAELRVAMDADLTVLHVRTHRGHASDPRTQPETGFDSFVSRVLDTAPLVTLMEERGEPVAEILHTAARISSDVIVMGTHGRTGVQRLLLGSVAERVIRQSSVPVLVVPPNIKRESHDAIRLETILCAVDFSTPSARAVNCAASIAAAAGARLVLAHALEWSEESEPLPGAGKPLLPSSEDDAVARLNGLLTDEIRARCDPEFVVGYGSASDEILRLVRDYHVDLVVLGTRQRNRIDLAVFGSTAQRLLRDGVSAMLTVRALESP
jgi:nucleotide-binding universal stress UspA family protein